MKGFTLLEALASVAILAIAMLVLMQSQTSALGQVLRVQDYERGVMITENQLHWTFLDLNEADEWEEYASAEGEDGDYLWQVEITPFDLEQKLENEVVMLRIVATTTWPHGPGFSSYQLETLYLWGEQK